MNSRIGIKKKISRTKAQKRKTKKKESEKWKNEFH